MNSTIKDLKERRSVRSYKDDQIKNEELEQILEAGTYAASGMGAQSPIMVVVQNNDVITKLAKMNAAVIGTPDADPFYGAPTIVLVFADKKRVTHIEDGSLVIGNLMLAAQSLGVASCWIHRVKEMFESRDGKAFLKEWGIKGDYVGVGSCILGYNAGEQPKAAKRKEGYIIRI